MINENAIVDKLSAVSKSIKEQLKKKGVIVPVKTKDGVRIEDYLVKQTPKGYAVLNKFGNSLYENLYYIQTAIIIANTLALKKSVRQSLTEDDMKAGVNEFDLLLYKQRLKTAIKQQDEFKMGHYQTRLTESQLLYKRHMDPINSAYTTLMNAVKSPASNNKYS